MKTAAGWKVIEDQAHLNAARCVQSSTLRLGCGGHLDFQERFRFKERTRRSVSMTRASEAASRTALTLSNLLLSSACVARFDGRLRSSSARLACVL